MSRNIKEKIKHFFKETIHYDYHIITLHKNKVNDTRYVLVLFRSQEYFSLEINTAIVERGVVAITFFRVSLFTVGFAIRKGYYI